MDFVDTVKLHPIQPNEKITHRSFDFVDRCATEIVYSERMKEYKQCNITSPVIENNVRSPNFIPRKSSVCYVVVPSQWFHVFLKDLTPFFVKICSNWPNQDLVLTCSILPRRVPG